MTAKLSDEQRSALRALKSAIDVARKDDPSIAAVELVAAISGLLEDEPITGSTINKWRLWPEGLDGHKSVAYRMLKRLGKGQYNNSKEWKDGLNYLEEDSAFDERAKPLVPSTKGLRLGRDMAAQILRVCDTVGKVRH